MRVVDLVERRSRLALRHFASLGGADPESVAAAMVGLHSSDPATVYLSLQARLPRFEHSDLEKALYDDRSLLRLLGMRRTMFVVPPDLAAAMDAACTKLLAPPEQRRLAKMVEEQGLAADGSAWVRRVCDETAAALHERGEALATELSEDVPELKLKLSFGAGKKWGGKVGVSTRILFLLATEGRIIRGRPRGTWLSSQYRWVTTEDWMGAPLPVVDKDEAQAELLRRWLAGFGPGTMTDLKWWTGWTVRDTKAALAAIDAVEVDLAGEAGYLLASDLEPVAEPEPWAALLPGLDPTPMGWKERSWFTGDHESQLFDRNGNIGPTVWIDGRIVGVWGQPADGSVDVRMLEPVTPPQANLIERQRRHLEDWLDGTIVMPRFPTPLQKEIAGR